jgi:hypothetical protein
MKTVTEMHITALKEESEEIKQRLDIINGLIKAGRPLDREECLKLRNLFVDATNSLMNLAPNEEKEESCAGSEIQDRVNDLLSEYIEENELDPNLLEGPTESCYGRLARTDSITYRDSVEFELPDSLLLNHRSEIFSRIQEDFFENDQEVFQNEDPQESDVVETLVEIE